MSCFLQKASKVNIPQIKLDWDGIEAIRSALGSPSPSSIFGEVLGNCTFEDTDMELRMRSAARAFITSGISESAMAVEEGGSTLSLPDWHDSYLVKDVRKDVADAVSYGFLPFFIMNLILVRSALLLTVCRVV